MTKLEQGCNKSTSQAPSLALSYADIVRKTSLTTNVIQTPPPTERLMELEYTPSEEERKRTLIKVKVTHPAHLNTSYDLEAHDKQLFAKHLDMPRREVLEEVHIAKMSQPTTVLIKLSDLRLIFFCSKPKNTWGSVMTRHVMICLLTKNWSLWNTGFSEILNPKRYCVMKLILQIFRWSINFRVKFLRGKKVLLAPKQLHTFPQTTPYRILLTTWICHTLQHQQPITPPFAREETAALIFPSPRTRHPYCTPGTM